MNKPMQTNVKINTTTLLWKIDSSIPAGTAAPPNQSAIFSTHTIPKIEQKVWMIRKNINVNQF